jgi:hypothetical protein
MQSDTTEQWQSAMRAGDFSRAWEISDRHLRERLARGDPQALLPRHLQSVWDGSPLAGKHVLIRCYHGLGDTVQFIRFAQPLRAMAREVSVWCQPELMPLISTAKGVDRALPLGNEEPSLSYDVDVEIMELAHALRIAPADLPGEIPYLHPVNKQAAFADCSTFNIGLVWAAGDWDRRRSMEPAMFQALARLAGMKLYSLQRDARPADFAALPIEDISSPDIEILASRLLSLDLLVSVDTFVAHLGGALGIPVCLLLHADCDWRWQAHHDTTPWYPTTRLFRQNQLGDWHSVIDKLMTNIISRLHRRQQ